jgi:hypothetical protein
MPSRIWIFRVAAALLLAGLVVYKAGGLREPEKKLSWKAAAQTEAAPTAGASKTSREPALADVILKLRPGEVLASVNQHEITVRDLLPVNERAGGNEAEIPLETFRYLLDRAVNRELIFQAAKNAGIGLDESQKDQLASLKSLRNQPEPGGTARLNYDARQADLELQDASAFLLQTALLAAKGVSPNVTPDQVSNYYQEHHREFEELPSTTPAREQAWNEIDFQIRQRLAPDVRANFQSRLTAYMTQIRAEANVMVTPIIRLTGGR